MALSKKHYEAIARRIKAQLRRHEGDSFSAAAARIALNELACDLAFDFRADNSRFDEARFLKACGF
jgi:hypothetical protein